MRAALLVVVAACSGNANQPCGDCGETDDENVRTAARSGQPH